MLRTRRSEVPVSSLPLRGSVPRRPRWMAFVASALAAWLLACSGLVDLEQLEAALTPEPPPAPAWVGVWEGPGHMLWIADDGTVQVSISDGGTRKNLTAPARSWEGGITIGIGPVTQTWDVQEPPHEVDGEWRMVFDGAVLVRKGPPPPGFGMSHQGLDANPNILPPMPADTPAPAAEVPAEAAADSDGSVAD